VATLSLRTCRQTDSDQDRDHRRIAVICDVTVGHEPPPVFVGTQEAIATETAERTYWWTFSYSAMIPLEFVSSSPIDARDNRHD
jgi:hypothetical protein